MTSDKSKIVVLPVKDKKNLPIFVGELTLSNTKAGPRPHRFRVTRNGQDELLPPEELLDLLKISDRIMISQICKDTIRSQIEKMLKDFQLSADIINVCRFCLLRNKFNFVNTKSIKYHKELICQDCAKEELHRFLENSGCNYGEETTTYLEELLLKTRDLDRTMGILNPDELDSRFTHFDTIQSETSKSHIKFKDLPLSKSLRNIYSRKSEDLLPVQSLAVEKGLFDGVNLLVTSVTATGKTLIGEMAGVDNALKSRGKMLYLVPLVALANQKYDQFSKKYAELGLKTSIRVGSTRIRSSKKTNMRTTLKSDLIVGTYEGIDYLLRSGKADLLGQIGTVVIDEVHMIEDQERGHRIDGLISRLKYISPESQFIYLSATVADPALLGKKLNCEVVEYEYRPVPIERHLVYCQEHQKNKLMAKLVKEEYSQRSSKGHLGQTIIFTNSRKNCQNISKALPISSSPYHAGMVQYERKKVEERFQNGKLPVVVTTAALAAGVDFPASQVIFESLAMGIEWISIQEFMQMLGRAGRPDYHDRGKVVLLAAPEKRYSSNKSETEDEVAIKLLKGEMQHIDIEYDEEGQMEEILASAAVTDSKKDLSKIQRSMVGGYEIDFHVRKLKKHGFLDQKGDRLTITRIGMIAAQHFLSVSKCILIRDAVLEEREPIEIVTNLELFDAAHFKSAAQISKALNVNLPSRVFQGASLDIIFEGESISRLDITLQDQLFEFATDFFTCGCKESPYCGCPERKFSCKILELREEGLSPGAIIDIFEDMYGITAYGSDIFDYLEQAVRNLDAVAMMAKVYSKRDVYEKANSLRKRIEG